MWQNSINSSSSALPRLISAFISSPVSAEKGVLVIIAVGTLFRIVAGWGIGLGFGESYYFSAALRPSMGYLDQPPLAILTASLSMYLTGAVGPLVIRLPFIIMFALTTWLIFLLGKRLFGPWSGFYAALLFNLSAVFTLTTAIFFQPDGPLMLFWLLSVLCLLKIFFDSPVEHPYFWWAATGVTLGLTLLSKYHAIFIIFGAGMFAITFRNERHWIWHPGSYMAMVIALIIFSPTIIWNYQNNWISFVWQGSRGLDYQGIRIDWLIRSILGQAVWLLPWIWAPLLWELFKNFRRGPQSKERWFIAWMAVAPIAFFTLTAAYAPLGYHSHWLAPGYLMLFLSLGDTLHKRLLQGDKKSRQWLVGSLVFTCVALTFVTTHAATGWSRILIPQVLKKKLEKAKDPSVESFDYSTLEAAFTKHGLFEKKDLFVFTNRWFQSGKVDYALKGKRPVLCLNPDDPRSFAFWYKPEEWLGKDGILVSSKKFLNDPASYYGNYFSKIEFLGTVEIPRGKYIEETLYLHYMHNYHTPFPMPYQR